VSGFCGLVAPADVSLSPAILEAMTQTLAGRGPDGGFNWQEGPAGLGYTHLDTGDSAPSPRRPWSLDPGIRLTGDLRLDAREVLREALAAAGRTVPAATSDGKLALHAWSVWRESCVEHLLGDFAFLIWDSIEQILFGARDRFGIKPFYYATADGGVQVSNTPACLLSHPGIDPDPDEAALADYLLFGFTPEPDRTAYTAIRRLPPGHTLTWSAAEGLKVRRYWELPTPPLLHYRRPGEYTEHFTHLMTRAIRDRLPPDRAGILLSGGLDSALVAAVAREIAESTDPGCALQACTFVYERLIEDETASYAAEVATALALPHLVAAADDDEDLLRSGPVSVAVPPELQGIGAGVPSIVRTMTSFAGFRVGLTGHGGDPALHPGPAHAGAFLRHALCGGLPWRALRYRLRQGRWPRLGLRRALGLWFRAPQPGNDDLYPPWFEHDFAARLDTRGRWRAMMQATVPAATLRSEAHRYLSLPLWPHLFESFDPGVTGLQAELRHPFFDLRLIAFLLALPPVPWCVDKQIIRHVLTDRLPAAVVDRPKAPLPDIPVMARLDREQIVGLDLDTFQRNLSRYVDFPRFLLLLEHPERLRAEEAGWVNRPLVLARWLAALRRHHPPAA